MTLTKREYNKVLDVASDCLDTHDYLGYNSAIADLPDFAKAKARKTLFGCGVGAAICVAEAWLN
jgi:hypothetical protein